MARAIRQILSGMGHIFDFSGHFEKSAFRRVKERQRRQPQDVSKAIQSDLNKISADLRSAMDSYKAKHG